MSSESSDTSDWSNFARPGEERIRISRRRNTRTYGRQPYNRPPHRRPNIIFLRPDNTSSSSSSSNRMSPRERRVIMAARPATPPQRPATPPSPIRTPSPFISYRYRDPVPEQNNDNGDERDRMIQELLEQQRLQQLRLDEAMNQNEALSDRINVLERENIMLRVRHQLNVMRDGEQVLMIRTLQREIAAVRNEASRIILSDSDNLEEASMNSPTSSIVQPEGPDASPIPSTSGTQVFPPRGKKRRSSSDDDNGTPEKRARPASPYSRASLSPIPGPSAVTPPQRSPILPTLDDLYFRISPSSSSSPSPSSSSPASSTSHPSSPPSSTLSTSSGLVDPLPVDPPISPTLDDLYFRISPASSSSSSSSLSSPASSLSTSSGPVDPLQVDPPSPRRSPTPPPPWRNGLQRYDLRTGLPRPNYNDDEYYEGLDVDWDD